MRACSADVPAASSPFTCLARSGRTNGHGAEAPTPGTHAVIGCDAVWTLAGIALYAYVHRAAEGGFELGPRRALRRWRQRIEARPVFLPWDVIPVGELR